MAPSLIFLPSSLRPAILSFRPYPIPLSFNGTRLFSSTRKMSSRTQRTYASALALLDSLQTNRAVTSAISSTPTSNANAIPEMLEWARKAGYAPYDFAARGLKCVHIAGTKGKGSVAIMVESILLQYWKASKSDSWAGPQLGRVGTYTSPHLIHVRERIRIDGTPISELLFTRYFYELWDRLAPSTAEWEGGDRPGYFRYLTLLAFHAFIREGVQSAVVECGIGGEYDSTNILPKEAVSVVAITSLGIDHVGMLGGGIGSIAWHKGGIIKEGVPAFTVVQEAEAQRVLEERGEEKGVDLTVVPRMEIFDTGEVKLGLEGGFQKDNASLAIAVAVSHLRALDVEIPQLETSGSRQLPPLFLAGLTTATLPARCQVLTHSSLPNTTFFIDGAHTHASLTETARWFNAHILSAYESGSPPIATMLIFNQESDRNAQSLLTHLISELQGNYPDNADTNVSALNLASRNLRAKAKGSYLQASLGSKRFTYAAFCRNEPVFRRAGSQAGLDGALDVQSGVASTHPGLENWELVPGPPEPEQTLKHQHALARVYQTADSNALHMVYPSIEEALELAERVSVGEREKVFVLVTGSLHLAGGVLNVLEGWRRAGRPVMESVEQ